MCFDSKYLTCVSETSVTVIGKLVGACNYINGRHKECIIIFLFIDSSACSVAISGHCGYWRNCKGCVLKNMEYFDLSRGSYVTCLSIVLFINIIIKTYILQMIGTLYCIIKKIALAIRPPFKRDGFICICSLLNVMDAHAVVLTKVILSAITRCSSLCFF
jgi:hypothetical protein